MSKSSGVGMPAALYLQQFGELVNDAFGAGVYHVGSSMPSDESGRPWRDVDVRVILDDEQYAAMGLGDPDRAHHNSKWVALTLAFSALGKAMTGLPIDFQIQQQSHANAKNEGCSRSALFSHHLAQERSDAWDRAQSAVNAELLQRALETEESNA